MEWQFYGAAYEWAPGQWKPVAICYTPGGAVDAAILSYDKHNSFAAYGWDAAWPRDRKVAFLRKRGMRVKKFVVRLAASA
jgi:hypothetical protein